MSATENSRSNRFLVLLLLLVIPLLCATIAWASRMEINSDYFSLRFGPPSGQVTTGGTAASGQLPSTGGSVSGNDGIEITVDPNVSVATPETCFLNLVCLSSSADVTNEASGGTGVDAGADGSGVNIVPEVEGTNSLNLLPESNQQGDLDLDLQAQDLGLDTGAEVNTEDGVSLDLNELDLPLTIP